MTTSHVSPDNVVPGKPQLGAFRRLERSLRPRLQSLRDVVREPFLAWAHPEALAFYRRAVATAYLPDDLIDVVPQLKILYLATPKAASSRIRSNLAAMIGNDTVSGWRSDQNWKVHNRKASRLQAPRHGIVQFHHMATSAEALRFTFVRNPYTRLLSCWADQYRDRPLVPGYGRVEVYLAHRERADPALPVGADKSLSFADFVAFACKTSTWRIDKHWQRQSDIVEVPGVAFDLIGKTETFAKDFERVLDHVGAGDDMRRAAIPPLHTSSRRRLADYFTPELADSIYRAYERDFDQFGYARALPK
ncbi:sulfotransferase family protein [Mesorhizobium sp. M1217]|uniref:sulfotransferase family protein n=1 Tax=Mesorhizobium sp. M1217 TaxID=2957070 RepID=UPI00333DF0A1